METNRRTIVLTLRLLWAWRKRAEGSMVVEASLLLPFFLVFVFLLITLVRIHIAEMALQTAVSETTKQFAAHMYPVELIYKGVKGKVENSNAAANWEDIKRKIEEAKDKLDGAEEFIGQFEAYIPDPLVAVLGYVKQIREQADRLKKDGKEAIRDKIIDPAVQTVFTSVLYDMADQSVLQKDRLTVTGVNFPDFGDRSDSLMEIEAEYIYYLSLPFIQKEIVLKRKASERAWLGA
ncbi:TadE family protein [Paenibacillus larvae]|nr:TadE family protein [Paenibacillus larvae]AQR77237.1 hypothetical protein BXP28_07540 [Paenibacillus larvae subsp. larvae]AQT86452.1 hypothetical protein B1222_21945 [Paenibacillus larvae subsp. pulvifaciens]AQZ48110.1 hypothetical protein B5S25_17530 [Paenibacillus larvae subsp. pulvifaciens]ARF66812.1 hypothetical protein B7C51_01765 [Paenibacillus larvae subsp. pulvifaciens]MBH0342460.1 hypothetical protein [Paenibacillus larvae]